MLARYKYILGFVGVGLLLLPLAPGIGATINGARLWLQIGSYSFQPGELAKICLVIFFAAYLAERKELLAIASRRVHGNARSRPQALRPASGHVGDLPCGHVLREGSRFESALLLDLPGDDLHSHGPDRVRHLWFHVFATRRLSRISDVHATCKTESQVWLDVFDPQRINDEGFQLAQSLFALATGGLFGTGFGQGRPDLIPEAQTDFVFSALGEELGLLGTTAILLCFILLVARGLRIAINARDDFGKLLAAGLTAIFGIQTIIILGGVTRLLPLTGSPCPSCRTADRACSRTSS